MQIRIRGPHTSRFHAFSVAEAKSQFAERKLKSKFVGLGCVLQGFGFIAPVVGGASAGVPGMIIGGIALVVLVIVGTARALQLVCGNCGNPLSDHSVAFCPACKSHLH